MFDEAILQLSTKVRTGPSQLFSEWVAAFGLVLTILLTLRAWADAVPTAGWPLHHGRLLVHRFDLVSPTLPRTIARAFSNTFAGIRPTDAPMFILAQMVGAVVALCASRLLVTDDGKAVREPQAE